jgi:phage gp29-like protein
MAQILDQHGNPIQPAILTEPQTARLGWLKRELAQHPSRGLTPAKLARILDDAEAGDLVAQFELCEDMEEKDGHLFAELSKRKRALLTVEWDLLPPPNPSAQETKDTEALKERLEALEDFEDVVLGMADGIGKGFACQEIEWERLGREWLPKRLTFRPQSWFTLDQETHSEILLRNLAAHGEPLTPFGWVKHVHRARPGYIARAGLHRQLSWPYLFKVYAIGDLAEFLEIYGLPIRIGTYPASATQEEKATLLRAVVNLGHDAAGIIPEGMLIDFKEPANATAAHETFMAMVDLMERTESKVILGGTLTSQADGKTSTNALGKVHNDVRLDILAADARQMESTVRRDLLYPVGILNGWVKDPRRVPRFRFDVQEEADFAVLAEAMPKVVDMGLRVPADWAREQLRIPEARDGEEVLEPRAVAAPADPNTPPERSTRPGSGDRPGPGVAGQDDPAGGAGRDRRAAAGAVLAALAAAFPQAEAVSFPDQAALDRAIDALDPAELERQAGAVLAPIVRLIQDGQSYEEILGALAARYPDMDDKRLILALERAWFVADLWGQVSAGAADA